MSRGRVFSGAAVRAVVVVFCLAASSLAGGAGAVPSRTCVKGAVVNAAGVHVKLLTTRVTAIFEETLVTLKRLVGAHREKTQGEHGPGPRAPRGVRARLAAEHGHQVHREGHDGDTRALRDRKPVDNPVERLPENNSHYL